MSNIYSDEYKSLTRKLKEARINIGFTQKYVAAKLGKPQSYVSKTESGERRLDVTELKKFAELYKRDINSFIK